jgi:hypothetical protein
VLQDESEVIVAEEGAMLDEHGRVPAEGQHGRTEWSGHEEKMCQQLKVKILTFQLPVPHLQTTFCFTAVS